MRAKAIQIIAPERDCFVPACTRGVARHLLVIILFLLGGTPAFADGRIATSDGPRDVSHHHPLVAITTAPIAPEMHAGHGFLGRWEARVSRLFNQTMIDLRDRRGSGAFLLALLVAFLYGVLHTLGPGHGKTVVVSYFVGEGGSLVRGIGMGTKIAVFHVLSAIVIVLLTDFAVRQVTGRAPSDYRAIRLFSYAGIAAIGLWMLIVAIRRRALDRDHHACCGCSSLKPHAGGAGSSLALAIGAVPCTGALLVLLFGMANDLLWPSVVMAIAISAGMALALSAVGCLAILGRRAIDHRLASDPARRVRMTGLLRIAAAVAVVMIGSTLFVLTWTSPSSSTLDTSDCRLVAPDAVSEG